MSSWSAGNGARPQIGGEDGVALIAFWDSHAHASNSPNARESALGTHADTIGTVTVQPTNQLVLLALRPGSSPRAREQAFEAALKRIETCVS